MPQTIRFERDAMEKIDNKTIRVVQRKVIEDKIETTVEDLHQRRDLLDKAIADSLIGREQKLAEIDGKINGLQQQRAAMTELIEQAQSLGLVPGNDPGEREQP